MPLQLLSYYFIPLPFTVLAQITGSGKTFIIFVGSACYLQISGSGKILTEATGSACYLQLSGSDKNPFKEEFLPKRNKISRVDMDLTASVCR